MATSEFNNEWVTLLRLYGADFLENFSNQKTSVVMLLVLKKKFKNSFFKLNLVIIKPNKNTNVEGFKYKILKIHFWTEKSIKFCYFKGGVS